MSDPSDIGSDIANFYRGRSVFITGGTGFMGKVLMEKLLRSCPGIANVYVLVRPKRGNDVKTRMDELLNTTIFDWLRKEQPEALAKAVPIPGDITSPGLGISPADYKVLIENVSVVFHSAATVKFDEPLKLSVAMNILGTKSVVELCRKMEKLQAVVHVSTAYCNCDRPEVNEFIYPPPADPEKIIKCVEWIDEDLMDTITPRIIGSRPNTYTFTKALAEHVFIQQSEGLPAAIVRPSIVTAAWKEPLTGWIDNLNGPTGLLAGAGKGVLRTLLCYRDLVADLIPVDIAINLLVSVAWHTATARPNNIMIYNCTSGSLNPIKWKEIEEYGQASILERPFNDIIWYPGGSFKSSRLINNLCVGLFHVIPAYVLDTVSKVSGKKPMMIRIQQKFRKAISALEFFTTHEWKFSSNNVTRLYSRLSEQDKRIFNFDVRQVSWKKYMDNYVEGIRLYILKEEPGTTLAAKNHLQKMYVLHKTTQLLTLVLLWRVIMMRSETARKMWSSLWTITMHFARLIPLPAGN